MSNACPILEVREFRYSHRNPENGTLPNPSMTLQFRVRSQPEKLLQEFRGRFRIPETH